MKVPFSPPDITEKEIEEITAALQSGWITTGPRTKEFERQIARFVHRQRAVCLNSATACMELTLRLLGVGEGDEVITSAYTIQPAQVLSAMWVQSLFWWIQLWILMRWIMKNWNRLLQSGRR